MTDDSNLMHRADCKGHTERTDRTECDDSGDGAQGPAHTLAVWRASGAHRRDPLQFAFLEALARRTRDHQGHVRQVLDEKLAAAIARYAEGLQVANLPSRAAQPEAAPDSTSPLAALLASLQPVPPDAQRPGGPLPVPVLKAVTQHQRTWTRLRTEQRLQQSRARVPGNAGPLHSQALVLRLMTQLRALSPDYLAQFVSHAETLLWLDQVSTGGLPATGADAGAMASALASTAAAASVGTPGRAAVSPTGVTAAPAPPRRSRAKR